MVIDTSILIEHLRKKPFSSTNFDRIPPKTLVHTSAVTVYEVLTGAINPDKWKQTAALISQMIILPVDIQIAIKAAQLSQEMKGNFIGMADTIIAATALYHNLPIKTLNMKHFSRVTGLVVL